MNISTEISKINKILVDYKGEQAKIWLFDISHTKLAIKIFSNDKEDIIYLIMSGCKYIRGRFSLKNPKFIVNKNFDDGTLETKIELVDENSDFKLISTAGIALAKGLEQEFGTSFENFISDK